MHDTDKLRQVVETLEKTGGYGSVLLRGKQGRRAHVTKQEEIVTDIPEERGAVLSLFDGQVFHEAAVDSHDAGELAKAAKDLVAKVKVRPGLVIDPGPAMAKSFETKVKTEPDRLGAEDILAMARDHAELAKTSGPLVFNHAAAVNSSTETMTFVNRNKALNQKVHRVVSFVQLFVQQDGETRDFFDSKGLTGDISGVAWSKADLAKSYETAASLLGTKPPAPGLYTIGGSSHLSGLLAHEGFGHNAEIDMMLKNRSKAKDYLGKRVASDLVNIVDDPTLVGGYGGYFFDDDGTIATPTTIVQDGIFKTGLANLSSALQLDQPVTANSRRESYKRKAYARMSTTFFKPGDSTVADIIGAIDDGIYLDRFQTGMEDPKGWGIQIKFTVGREVKNGKLTGKIYSPVGLTGYVPDILGKVDMVAGDDFQTEAGTCGKGHKEFVPNSSGGVSIKTEAYLG